MPEPLHPALFQDTVRRALAEDDAARDITSEAIVPPDMRARGAIVAKAACVLAGLDVAREVFDQVDRDVEFVAVKMDGERCRPGDVLARVGGRARAMLAAERTALNFLQHLSGVATLTRQFVDAAAGRLTILDTRKTLPTLRALQKYAVLCGGGVNHRMGLADGVLVKDNHVRIAGGVAEAIGRVRAAAGRAPIEIEAQSLDDVDAAVAAGADVVMLDNLDDAAIGEAIGRIGRRARVEVSGGVTLERLARLASLGADSASVGALTHSAPAVDISFEMETRAAGKGN